MELVLGPAWVTLRLRAGRIARREWTQSEARLPQ